MIKRFSLIVFSLLLALPFSAFAAPLPGMPPVLDTKDIYSANRPNNLSDTVKNMPERVYVPNLQSSSVTVIDPKTYKVLKIIKTRSGPTTCGSLVGP